MPKTATKALNVRPTQKHKRLAAEVIQNTKREKPLTRTQMLMLSGYSRGTVDKTPFKPFTTQGFQVALREAGVDESKMSRVVSEAMDAKVITTFHGEARETDAPDHAIRLRAADQLADLTGAKITKIQVQSVNVNLNSDDLAQMMGL